MIQAPNEVQRDKVQQYSNEAADFGGFFFYEHDKRTNAMANMMKSTQRVIHKQTNRALAGATKRYKKFMRQASKAASEHKREQYVAAALGALVVTGMVASKMMAKAKIDAKKTAVAATANKKRKKKAKKKAI